MDRLMSKALQDLYQLPSHPSRAGESFQLPSNRLDHLLSSLPSGAIYEAAATRETSGTNQNLRVSLNSSESNDHSTGLKKGEKVEGHDIQSEPLNEALLASICAELSKAGTGSMDEAARVEIISQMRQLIPEKFSNYNTKLRYTSMLASVKSEVFETNFEDDFNKALKELKRFGLGDLHQIISALAIGKHPKHRRALAAWISEQQSRDQKQRADQVMSRWLSDSEIGWLDLRHTASLGRQAFLTTFAAKLGWAVDHTGVRRLRDLPAERQFGSADWDLENDVDWSSSEEECEKQ